MKTWCLLTLIALVAACGGAATEQHDASTTDSGGAQDTGVPDSGAPDSAGIDGGSPDSGVPDSGNADGGPADAGACVSPVDCSLPANAADVHCAVPGAEVCFNALDDDDDGLADCADPDCAAFPGCQTSHACAATPDCTDPACATNATCIALHCTATADFGTLQPAGSTSTLLLTTVGTTDTAVTPCAPGGAGMVVAQVSLAATTALRLAFTQAAGADHVFSLSRAGSSQGCGANPVLDGCFDPLGAASGTHTWPKLAAGRYYLIAEPHEPLAQGSLSVTLASPTGPEVCNNGIDDNGDGRVDCSDELCAGNPSCASQLCVLQSDLGALVADGRQAQFDGDTRGTAAGNTLSCVQSSGGNDWVLGFMLHERAGVLLEWSETGQHVVALARLGTAGRCDDAPLSCLSSPKASPDPGWWPSLEPGAYALIFKATAPGAEGVVTGHLRAVRAGSDERCHDGVDDDCNGKIDCADPACSVDPGCAKQPPPCTSQLGCGATPCSADVDLGTLAVGGSEHKLLDVKAQGTAGRSAACAEAGGRSLVATVRLTQPGALQIDCTQTGDQVLDLHQLVDPRASCDALEVTCVRPATFPLGCGDRVPNLQPGLYALVVQAFAPGKEGTVDLTLSELADVVGEICDNGIDDDGNGLIDCEDPKCAGAGTCVPVRVRPDCEHRPGAAHGGAGVGAATDPGWRHARPGAVRDGGGRPVGGARVFRLRLRRPHPAAPATRQPRVRAIRGSAARPALRCRPAPRMLSRSGVQRERDADVDECSAGTLPADPRGRSARRHQDVLGQRPGPPVGHPAHVNFCSGLKVSPGIRRRDRAVSAAATRSAASGSRETHLSRSSSR
jgi:hypothetical protein